MMNTEVIRKNILICHTRLKDKCQITDVCLLCTVLLSIRKSSSFLTVISFSDVSFHLFDMHFHQVLDQLRQQCVSYHLRG